METAFAVILQILNLHSNTSKMSSLEIYKAGRILLENKVPREK